LPDVAYAGHSNEAGYNALYVSGVRNGYFKNIRVRDSDSALLLNGITKNITVDGLVTTPRSVGSYLDAHYGVGAIGGSHDNLFKNISLWNNPVHDLSLSQWANGNVFYNIDGFSIQFDHHGSIPFGNLIAKVHAGRATDTHLQGNKDDFLWRSGGVTNCVQHAGAWNTYWGNTSDNFHQQPNTNSAYQTGKSWDKVTTNIVGAKSELVTKNGVYKEMINGGHDANVAPANLYCSMVKLRTGSYPKH
jgi:hypothetical protein